MCETPTQNGSGQVATARSPTAVLGTMDSLKLDRVTRLRSEERR